MANGNSYITVRDGAWTLWVLPECWTPALWDTVLSRLAQQAPSKHPQTLHMESGSADHGYYLKIFYPYTTGKVLKDSFRLSKARRAQQMSGQLAAAGFHAPLAIAAGEKRKRSLVECSFLLTAPVAGMSLIEALAQHHRGAQISVKRTAIQELAREIRRFHDLGFVHGDLLPTNIFVHPGENQQWQFYFMDNDRTRRYPPALPQSQWKRNLVQLNRMPLPGISLHDRMRFLRAYLGSEFASKRVAVLARWLEEKTRRRRWQCDRAKAESFRSLMRWQSPPAQGIDLA